MRRSSARCTPFTVWLIDVHEHVPPRPDAVQVIVGAKPADESHTGELHIRRARLAEPARAASIASACDKACATAALVLAGRMPRRR